MFGDYLWHIQAWESGSGYSAPDYDDDEYNHYPPRQSYTKQEDYDAINWPEDNYDK